MPDSIPASDAEFAPTPINGAPPVDLSECEFVALDNRTPKTVEFEGLNANKTVHFVGRWQNSRGEKGPLSETVSATVTG